MKTPPTAPWHDVMAGLIGRRLAIFDEMLSLGTFEPRNDDEAEAMRWLSYHRLAWFDEPDGWRARPVLRAKELWEREGANAAAASVAVSTAPSVPAAPRPVVQTHQVEIFAMEGYAA